jgi:hypothetical protein
MSIKLKTGDIVLSNWLTLQARLLNKAGFKWSHASIIVMMDDTPHIYETSFEHKKPTITLLEEQLEDDKLTEMCIRSLKKPLNSAQEAALKTQMIEHEKTVYPPLHKLFIWAEKGGIMKNEEKGVQEMCCSQIVYKVLEECGFVPETDKPITPDSLAPGGSANISRMYSNNTKCIARRVHHKTEASNILHAQLKDIAKELLEE